MCGNNQLEKFIYKLTIFNFFNGLKILKTEAKQMNKKCLIVEKFLLELIRF